MNKRKSKLVVAGEGVLSVFNKIFDNKFRKIGISWWNLRKAKYFSKEGLNSLKVFKHPTYFNGLHEFLYGLEEIFIDEIYLQNLPKNAFILDCGAHIGLSVIYLKHLCPSANIIAFEPDTTNFTILKKNIESHHLQNIELKKEAVWTSSTTVNFVSDGTMSSKIEEEQKNATGTVQTVRLRDFLTKKVDFLKLDIEGAEFEVIKDIEDSLLMIENLFIEYHGYFGQNNRLNEILQIITKSQFTYYIKEATPVYNHPFYRTTENKSYDVQLNIFCFRP